MAGSLFCIRKSLGFGAAKYWVAVSRVGPSTRPPTTSESNTNAHGDGSNTAVAIIVIAATVSALLCLCIVVLVTRKTRRRLSLRSDPSAVGGASPEGNPEPTNLWKSVEGQEEEEACNEGAGRRRSGQRVEQLVVMAGEDMPTFLAHPVSAPSMAACRIHIQCPPLHF